ncbi:MAG: inositol-3-phosphate synthase [Nanoarchaeota archaeon]|nr:inositol-3-phosphate synthase [Nanoarchaeota archaeon]
MTSDRVKIAIAGVGNCASSLIQGIHMARDPDCQEEARIGIAHPVIGGFGVEDIDVVAGFDIDLRKVGKDVGDAIHAKPNNTKVFYEGVPHLGVEVLRGPTLDGFAREAMQSVSEDRRFVESDIPEKDFSEVVGLLRESGADMLINYLPVGSEKATEFYADACLHAGIGYVGAIPVFIASDPKWIQMFEDRGLVCAGDDIKAQIGATITHRTLTKMFQDRGAVLDRTYQLNTGGNTDFLNMKDQSRLESKKTSKTGAVQSQLDVPLPDEDIHIGPSDYVAWQNDNKVCFIRMEGRGFGGVPLNLELRLSVEDSPNSGGVMIDAIRGVKVAQNRGEKGLLREVSAYSFKHPLIQLSDPEAREALDCYVEGRVLPGPIRVKLYD